KGTIAAKSYTLSVLFNGSLHGFTKSSSKPNNTARINIILPAMYRAGKHNKAVSFGRRLKKSPVANVDARMASLDILICLDVPVVPDVDSVIYSFVLNHCKVNSPKSSSLASP